MLHQHGLRERGASHWTAVLLEITGAPAEPIAITGHLLMLYPRRGCGGEAICSGDDLAMAEHASLVGIAGALAEPIAQQLVAS